MQENKEVTRKIEDEKAQGMGRGAFLASLFGAPVVVKAMEAAPIMDGNGVARPGLLVFEIPNLVPPESIKSLREAITPYADRCGFEFLILHGGATVKRVS